jgi:hypothetical protein
MSRSLKRKLTISFGKGVREVPYRIEKDGENYNVVNAGTGEVKAVHEPPDAEEKAKKQVNLLHGIEHGWEPSDGAK